MQTCDKMQAVITEIAVKHGLDLTAREAHLRLVMEPYQPLVMEKVGQRLVSVTHYADINGDLVGDPDILFFQSPTGWVPVEITQILGYRQVAWLTPDGCDIAAYHPYRLEGVAEFADLWAVNIREQGWLTDGIKDR